LSSPNRTGEFIRMK